MNRTYFVINPETRAINNKSNTKIVLAKGDHNSKVFTFELPKIVEGHDITKCNKVEIHYDNVSTAGNKKNSDVHPVSDLKISEEDESKVIFTWGITRNATKYAGTLKFGIEFGVIEDEEETWSWGTSIFNNIVVIDNIHNSESIAEMYANVISQILVKLESISNSLVDEETIKEAVNEWLVNNPIENKGITEEQVINRVNDYLTEQYTIEQSVNVTINKGMLSSASGTIFAEGNGAYQYTAIPVSEGEKYYISASGNNHDYAAAWYSLNGTKVSTIQESGTVEHTLITVPSGIDTLHLNCVLSALSSGIAIAKVVTLSKAEVEYLLNVVPQLEASEAELVERTQIIDAQEYDIKQMERRLIASNKANDFVWGAFDKAYFVFVIDDCNGYLPVYADLFASLGQPLSSATIADKLNIVNKSVQTGNTRTHKAILQEMVANGGEVLAHYNASPTDDTSDAEWLTYTRDVKKTLEDNGFECRGIIRANSTLIGSVKGEKYCQRYFEYSDGLGSSTQYDLQRKFFMASDMQTLDSVKAYIDNCCTKKGIFPFCFHGDRTDEAMVTVDNMTEIVNYIISKGTDVCECTTYANVFDTFGSSVIEQRLLALENA